MTARETAPGSGVAPDALKIFISYSRRDLAAADAMVAALESHGFAVTIDRRDLPYGEEWQKELAGFIAASDTVVWLVSPDSVKSKWVNWELGEVGRLSKRLIPVKVRETPPEELPEALGRIHLLPAEGEYEITSVAFSPDSQSVVTSSVDRTARIWDAHTGVQKHLLSGHSAPVTAAIFSPDGNTVVTSSDDGTVRLWEARTGQELGTVVAGAAGIGSVAFSPAGDFLAISGGATGVQVFDLKNRREVVRLSAPGTWSNSAAFSPDGSTVVTADQDGLVRVWSATDGREVLKIRGHGDRVTRVAISKDGARIVSGSADRTARVWDAVTGAEIGRLYLDGAFFISPFEGLALSPSGAELLVSSTDGKAGIWDISSIEKGDAFQIACQRLGNNTSLKDVQERYGLGELTPICGDNPPLPVEWSKLQ